MKCKCSQNLYALLDYDIDLHVDSLLLRNYELNMCLLRTCQIKITVKFVYLHVYAPILVLRTSVFQNYLKDYSKVYIFITRKLLI